VAESASSTPSASAAVRGERRAKRPKAPSACTQASCARAVSAASRIGSKWPAFTSPALAMTTAGPAFFSSRSRAAGSKLPSGLEQSVTRPRPIPSIASALSAETWMKQLLRTGICGRPARPVSETSTPCCSPHHWRAAARPVKFAVVAPVVRTPPQWAGSPKRSSSHATETCSSRAPSGVASQPPAFWSSRDVTQSAASAAGVEPPITQWKKRGPAERTCASMPSASSSSIAASVPAPSSGSGPPNRSAASSEPADRAAAWVEERRPDLTLISGDLLSRRSGEGRLRSLLARLPGCYAVLGNHDLALSRDPFSEAVELWDLEPATLLRDESRLIDLRGRSVQIVGVDPRSYRRGLARPARLADPDADLRILLCHFPDVVNRLPEGAFQLVLSGHLHAGRICVPWPGARLPPGHIRWTYVRGPDPL